MILVADASVSLKWFVPEADSALAESLIRPGVSLHAPRFLAIETVNAAWNNWRKRLIDETIPPLVNAKLEAIVNVWHPDEGLIDDAVALAMKLGHSTYDCLYLALAAELAAPVVTTDRRLLAIAPAGLAVALEDWRP